MPHKMKSTTRIILFTFSVITILLLGFIFIRRLIDFPVYYSAGRSLLSGRTDLYASDFAQGRVMDYRYPPFFLVALAPLWMLPFKVAAYIWYLLSALEVAGIVFILRRVTAPLRPPRVVWVVSLLAAAQYFVMILHYGNAHLPAIFLLFSSFYLMTRGRDKMAALLIALSITVKLTPVLLLPYFALKRKWKYVIWTCVFLVAINLAPAAYFGPGTNSQLLRTWYEHVVVNQEFHEVNGPVNLSLKGQLRRYFSAVDYSERVDGDTNYPAVNVADLPARRVEIIWVALAAVVFLSSLALIRRDSRGDKRDRLEQVDPSRARAVDLLEMGLMICVTLFVGPLSSKIYFIALAWPVATLASFAFGNDAPPAKLSRVVLVFVAFMNCVLPLLPGRSVQRLLLALGADFYMNALVMLAIAVCLVSFRRAIQRRAFESQTEALSAARMP